MNLNSILTERLAILGGTGSGKSYAARGLAERVLDGGHRLGVIDPTGVWWGLRSGHPAVLFGGDHADLPLTENSGRVIAQAVAGSQQSWIIDTSALKTKAAERRFMLDFLDALFAENRAPITLIVDEADRFSPQRMSPETARLHERMEEIVRRGRVRGFTPWLITQRPASLNKDVLSQATAMICMRMTGAHDRKAIADVIEGQADKTTAKAIVDAMPRHKVGSGMVWAPQQDILLPVSFPKIKTLDTMGPRLTKAESASLKPIDVGALKEKLATVETEAKANDPKVLKAENARLRSLLEKATTMQLTVVQDQAALDVEYEKGYSAGVLWTHNSYLDRIRQGLARINVEIDAVAKAWMVAPSPPTIRKPPRSTAPGPITMSASPPPPRRGNGHAAHRPPAQQRILDALAYLHGINIATPSRAQLALWAGVSPNSGSYFNNLGALRTAGLIDYPAGGGSVFLTAAGHEQANEAPAQSQEEMQAAVLAKLPPAKSSILRAVIEEYPNSITREALAEKIGVSSNSGSYFNNLGSLRTLGVIDYPQKGTVAAQPILFLE